MITQRPDKSFVVIVISPLSSLMFDQKAHFTPKISAEFLGELQQVRKAMERMKMGKHQLVLEAMLFRIFR